MTVQQPVLKSGDSGRSRPPRMAEGMLGFFLPAVLREPILGDLEEEFLCRLELYSSFLVYRWYWAQALKSTCLFIWIQRGAGMAFFLSVIFFLFVLGAALFTAEFGLWLVSPPVILLLVPTSLILGIGATSSQAAGNAFRLSFSESDQHSRQQIDLASRFLHVTGNQFLLVGGVSFFLGVILLLVSFSQNPLLVSEGAQYARYGVALLPLFYGMIFKCLFYSAEQKIAWKYQQQ